MNNQQRLSLHRSIPMIVFFAFFALTDRANVRLSRPTAFPASDRDRMRNDNTCSARDSFDSNPDGILLLDKKCLLKLFLLPRVHRRVWFDSVCSGIFQRHFSVHHYDKRCLNGTGCHDRRTGCYLWLGRYSSRKQPAILHN